MTTTTEPTATPAVAGPPPVRGGNPWAPTFSGIALVARIELLRRRPSKKGYVFYGLLFAGILGLGLLASAAAGPGKTSIPLELVLVLVLGAGFLIGPSLSATSINGDSSEGVLAPLQMTRLTAGDLAIGKLLASWAVSLAALVTMTPFLVYAFTRSGWTFSELALVLVIILFLVLMATAIGLAWSSIAARAVASVSLSHLSLGALTLGTLLLFFFTMPLISEEVEYTERYLDYEAMTPEQREQYDQGTLPPGADLPCMEQTYLATVAQTDKTAWLLLMNPVVVIAETAPIVDPVTFEEDGRAAPGLFAFIHSNVAAARLGGDAPIGYDECAQMSGEQMEDPWLERDREQANLEPAPWLGLGVAALITLGSLGITIRRLRVPYKKLSGGTRVA